VRGSPVRKGRNAVIWGEGGGVLLDDTCLVGYFVILELI
jgi:hypothetical protein